MKGPFEPQSRYDTSGNIKISYLYEKSKHDSSVYSN